MALLDPARPRRGYRFLSAIATAGLLTVACSGTGFRYVSNSDTQTFFKVPEGWRVYDQQEIFGGTIGGSQQGAQLAESSLWMVAFDAGTTQTVGALIDPRAEHPRGFANVRLLEAAERDVFSLRTIRNMVIPVDQLEADTQGRAEVLYEEELVLDGGFHGTRLLVRAQLNEGEVVIDQTGIVDPATRTVYLFVIGCGLECFDANLETIREVADSWTVKEQV